MSKGDKCAVCGLPLDNSETVIGAGGGAGADSAHHVCYLSREVARMKRAMKIARDFIDGKLSLSLDEVKDKIDKTMAGR